MRFHVFYFTPHPQRELRDNTEMWEGQYEKTLINLKSASRRTSRDWVLDSLTRSWLGQSWTLLWVMTFPIRADNEARGLRHYVHKSEVSSVCRSSLVLHSFSCNRTDHQSDSFLPKRRLEGLYSKWNIVENDKFAWICSNVPTSSRRGPVKQLIKAVKHLVSVPISL